MARMLEGVVVKVLHRRGNAIARLPEKPSPPRGQAHSTAWPGLAKATSRVMSRTATETPRVVTPVVRSTTRVGDSPGGNQSTSRLQVFCDVDMFSVVEVVHHAIVDEHSCHWAPEINGVGLVGLDLPP